MKIVVVTMFTHWVPHFETDLELMQNHLDRGDEVVHLCCRGDLLSCDANFYHDREGCRYCTARRAVGLGLLTGKVRTESFFRLTAEQKRELRHVRREFASHDDLKSYRIENLDLGYAALSSLISKLREPAPDLRRCAVVLSRTLVSTLAVFRSLQSILDVEAPDHVYVFNGRFAILRAVVRACESKGVPFSTHDRGHDLEHYSLFADALPHSIAHMESAIRKAWEDAAGTVARDATAEGFYHDRVARQQKDGYCLTGGQVRGMLPPKWDSSRRNVAVFLSSEDEFAAIADEWENTLYVSQAKALQKIARDAEQLAPTPHLYVRMHPNMSNMENTQTAETRELAGKNVTLIPPEAPVDSYALLKNATVVLTFGSTVGIEAVFFGKPIILAGPAFYRNLGGTYNPATHEELMRLLAADLPAKCRDGALMYGYFMKSFGIPFKHFRADGLIGGYFNGCRVMPVGVPSQTKCGLLVAARQRLFLARARGRLLGPSQVFGK